MIHPPSKLHRGGFTLVELLTVMAIIAILAGLTLQVSGFVQKKAAMSRADSEIHAMEAACEGYRSDTGAYPTNTDTEKLDPKVTGTPASYNSASLYLYGQLSGDTDYDGVAADGGAKTYMTFKSDMLGRASLSTPVSTTNKVTYLNDPWGSSYGYSTAGAVQVVAGGTNVQTKGYNPTFDLWSTAGKSTAPSPTNAKDVTLQWIKNWN